MIKNGNIIKPKIKDSLEIAKLIKGGWNSAYKGLISDEYLKNMNVEKLSVNWKNKIRVNENVYVYKDNNEILGVIIFGESKDFNAEVIGEVFVLYVKVEEKRKGIGTKLLKFAQNQLLEQGYEKMVIWCLKGNEQGSEFYKKHGGRKIKERDYIVGGIKVREEGFLFN